MVVPETMTGHGFERLFCGIASIDVDPRFRLGHVRDLKAGIERVKGWQRYLGNWDPMAPKTELSQCLFRRVAQNLRWNGRKLRLYISVGTRLDFMGVDCFFECKRRVVTLDLTVNEEKYRKHQSGANFIVIPEHFRKDQCRWLASRIADQIARRHW